MPGGSINHVGYMRIIALSTVKAVWEENPEYQGVKEPTLARHRHALHADWNSPTEIKQDFRSAGVLKERLPHERSECFGYGRVLFSIAENTYRLVVWINYAYRAYRVVCIHFIGTNVQYDKIDVQTI